MPSRVSSTLKTDTWVLSLALLMYLRLMRSNPTVFAFRPVKFKLEFFKKSLLPTQMLDTTAVAAGGGKS